MEPDSLTLHVHKWPWSFGNPEETLDCPNDTRNDTRNDTPNDTLDIDFAACPCLSCAADIELRVEGCREESVCERPTFRAGNEDSVLAMHALPHGVVAPVGERRHALPATPTLLAWSAKGHRRLVLSRRDDQALEDAPGERGIELEQTLLAWVDVYERFRKASRSSFRESSRDFSHKTARGILKNTRTTGELAWKDVCAILEELKDEDKTEPTRSLIVFIAQELNKSIGDIVSGSREIFERERRMQPAGKLTQLDHDCVRWLVRQPGLTTAEKAAVNRQRLLGVAHRETHDTLENRVLKDFLLRCMDEGRSYLQHACKDRMASRRARIVHAFKGQCESLVRHPLLANVAKVQGAVHPNHVLQNDRRYRKVWAFYQRLIRQQDDADKLWTWQNRTWNELASLMLHTALFRASQNDKFPFVVENLAPSSVKLLDEQQQGCFVARGSEPGPWMVHARGTDRTKGAVLEVIPGDRTDRHPLTRGLGRLGAWELVTITPLDENRQATVVALWPVHAAGTRKEFELGDIRASVDKALTRHTLVLNDLKEEASTETADTEKAPTEKASTEKASTEKAFTLRGMVLCSTLDKTMPDRAMAQCRPSASNVHVAPLHAQPELWSSNIDMLEFLVEDLLEKTL